MFSFFYEEDAILYCYCFKRCFQCGIQNRTIFASSSFKVRLSDIILIIIFLISVSTSASSLSISIVGINANMKNEETESPVKLFQAEEKVLAR